MVGVTLKAYILFICLFVKYAGGWKAISAHQAMYAEKSKYVGVEGLRIEENLDKDYLHSTYKFGYCLPTVIQRQFMKKTLNLTFPSYQSTQLNYIYVVTGVSTIGNQMQCVVMKGYVPRKYMFRKSRIPMYYCQGYLSIMMFNSIEKFAIHEFYLRDNLNMPIDFVLEFYQAL